MMGLKIILKLLLGTLLLSLSGMAHGENFYIQSDGKSVKVIAPSGRSDPKAGIPTRQGIWYLEDEQNEKSAAPEAAQTVDNVKMGPNQSKIVPVSKQRYTVGEARSRLERAKAQLEKDKDIVAKYADEADPNKLELWQARIATQEKIILEKEMALERIEDRYIRRLRQQRDARIYDDQSKYYERISTSDDLSFK